MMNEPNFWNSKEDANKVIDEANNLRNIINPTINYQVENILQLPILESEQKQVIDETVKENARSVKSLLALS